MPEWTEYTAEEIQEINDRGDSPEDFEAYILVKYDRGHRYAVREVEDDEPLNMESLIEEFVEWAYDGMAEIDPPLSNRTAGCEGEATLYLDGQKPFAAHCWTSKGFFTRSTTHA